MTDDKALGQLGRLTSVDDLPANFDDLVRQAVALQQAGSPIKARPAPKPDAAIHPEFAKALADHAAAKATFDAMAPSHRREYAEWINDAKRDETRARRSATAIEWLTDGRKRHWKYENC